MRVKDKGIIPIEASQHKDPCKTSCLQLVRKRLVVKLRRINNWRTKVPYAIMWFPAPADATERVFLLMWYILHIKKFKLFEVKMA